MSNDLDALSRRYHFFILGLWVQPGRLPEMPTSWRITLENHDTAERSGFTNLADLITFLEAWMYEQQSLEEER
jgi:hypothetical protein